MFWTQDSDPCVFPQWKFIHGSPSIPLTGALGPNLRFPSYYPIQKSQRNCNSIQVSPYLGQSWASLLLFIRFDFGDSLIYDIAIWISGPITDQICLLSCPVQIFIPLSPSSHFLFPLSPLKSSYSYQNSSNEPNSVPVFQDYL